MSYSAFPSKEACWINRTMRKSCLRRYAIKSSWDIRGSQFNFAAMLSDCHSRWRKGVAGEGWNLTFPRRRRSCKRDCLPFRLRRSKFCKNKQSVSLFVLTVNKNLCLEYHSYVHFFIFIHPFIYSISLVSYKLVFPPSASPHPMNDNVPEKQAYSNNKKRNIKT